MTQNDLVDTYIYIQAPPCYVLCLTLIYHLFLVFRLETTNKHAVNRYSTVAREFLRFLRSKNQT